MEKLLGRSKVVVVGLVYNVPKIIVRTFKENKDRIVLGRLP